MTLAVLGLNAYIICYFTLVMFLHYLILRKTTENLCCLHLSSVSGSEKNRLFV